MDWNTIRGLVPASGAQPDFADCLDAFPVLQRAKETSQEPRYHGEGDVWTHTHHGGRVAIEASRLPECYA
nr:hypothetical protein [Pectobacterium parvum]